MTSSKEQILKIFRDSNALLEGHFQLTSGLHSPHYFQCAKVLQHPQHLSFLAGEIARNFNQSEIDVVISPALGGIVVGTEVGRLIGKRTMFAERNEGVMSLRRGFELQAGERVLVVEDVVTTGGSVFEIIDLVRRTSAYVGGVGFIVDRSNGKVQFDTKQYSVMQLDVVTYPPSDCVLCKSNIPLHKPGSRGNY